ncbi:MULTISPECIES: Pvc16 family protein [unclassified Crossiella]|uniref:Pvc16 family protein n=1 Tax=unclassified Crossiella TaxID=2620835 RepID=UPI0020004FBA|nr:MULTISPECIES: Pvc16 family protein [unclassified Crossiella]MCK2244047.1 DUF4255 domain-containing protein [Crossiella sp. S99.2]MCK2257095.1 DUF4255 domain-containing protein [Crossiella sp. S99.1]
MEYSSRPERSDEPAGGVIREVDTALCRLLGSRLPQGVEVRLEPPTPTWINEANPLPAVHVFLYELRAGRAHRPARDLELSYLVAARAGSVAGEHELLGEALDALTAQESGQPVAVRLAEHGVGGLWSALGMPARAAFVISVTATLPATPDAEGAAPGGTAVPLQSDSRGWRLPS